MPEYLSPGVYIEEVATGPQPIEGVSTSTTGAVGVTVRGPSEGPPRLVTSFLDFVRTFGDFLPPPTPAVFNTFATDLTEGGRWWTFPLAVKGFFDNGGKRLFVKRVVSKQSTFAEGTLVRGLVSRVTRDAPTGATAVTLEHLIRVDATATTLTFHRGDNGTLLFGPLAVTRYDVPTSTLTIAATPDPLLASRGDFAVINNPVNLASETLTFSAAARGGWGNDIAVLVRPIVGTTYALLFDPSLTDLANSAQLDQPASVGDTGFEVVGGGFSLAGGRILINGDEYDFSAFDAFNKRIVLPAGSTVRANYPPGAVVRQLRRAYVTGTGTTVHVWGAQSIYPGAILEFDNGALRERRVVQSVDGNVVTFAGGPLTGTYWEGEAARTIEAEVRTRYAPGGVVQATETFTGLRLHDDGSPSFLVTAVNKRSQLVTVVTEAGYSDSDIDAFPAPKGPLWTPLAGGLDNNDQLTVDDFVGVDGGSGKRTGIQALEDIDEVSIVMAPGMWSGTVQSGLIQQCELMKNRFAILDSPRRDSPTSVQDVQAFRAPLDTRYAALYYPWLNVRDPSVQQVVLAPPSGHVAGIYARVDTERGVHKAPANEVIFGITQIDQQITTREQDLLNPFPVNINVLRFFPDRGNRVWGARVVTSDPQWKYVNVRRLFIFLESSLQVGTQWVVFEPNDEPLWARVRASVTNFLTTVWRSGALQGVTAAEALFVKVDRTTMTQDDIDNGRLIILVGVAPVKPAEFVIFRIQQKTLETAPAS
jgi:phage tail sheath protein FI